MNIKISCIVDKLTTRDCTCHLDYAEIMGKHVYQLWLATASFISAEKYLITVPTDNSYVGIIFLKVVASANSNWNDTERKPC